MTLFEVSLGDKGVEQIDALFDDPRYLVTKPDLRVGDHRVYHSSELFMRYSYDVFAIYFYPISEFPRDVQEDITERLGQITNEGVLSIIRSKREDLSYLFE